MYKKVILSILLWGALQVILGQSIQDSYQAEARGDYSNALLHMQKLVADEPDELFYSMRVAWLKYLSGDYQEALKLYQQGLSQLDHLDAHLGIINCHLALGQWEAALAKSEQLLPKHPQNTLIMGKAAYAAYMNMNYSKAAGFYASIAEIYPWDTENLGYWVSNLYLGGNIAEAKIQYAILKKYAPQSQIVIDYKGVLDLP
jgi:tetratricopeptide (TPR) repeat protein